MLVTWDCVVQAIEYLEIYKNTFVSFSGQPEYSGRGLRHTQCSEKDQDGRGNTY